MQGRGLTGAAVAAAAVLTMAAAQAAQIPADVERTANAGITRATLEAPIRFLSSDLLEGRGPATRGDQLARLYLQTRLEGLGYEPAFAKGAWQQPFDIVGLKAQFPKSWSFQGKGGARRARLAQRLHRRERGAGAERRGAERRAGIRRLRHAGPGVQVGRLQGHGPQGQGPGRDEQ